MHWATSHYIRVMASTSVAGSQTGPGELCFDKAPSKPFRLKVSIVGQPVAGSVTFTGTLDGNAWTETLPIGGGSAFVETCAGAIIECADFNIDAGATVEAKFIGFGGTAVSVECELVECAFAQIDGSRGTQKWPKEGSTQTADRVMIVDCLQGYMPCAGHRIIATHIKTGTVSTWRVMSGDIEEHCYKSGKCWYEARLKRWEAVSGD